RDLLLGLKIPGDDPPQLSGEDESTIRVKPYAADRATVTRQLHQPPPLGNGPDLDRVSATGRKQLAVCRDVQGQGGVPAFPGCLDLARGEVHDGDVALPVRGCQESARVG